MDELYFSHKFQKTYGRGDVIFTEGSEGRHMYVISSGQVNIEIGNREQRTVIATLGKGSIFGEMALIDNLPRSATAVAVKEDTQLLEIDHALFVYLVGQQPAFALTILKALSLRLREQTVNHHAHGHARKEP